MANQNSNLTNINVGDKVIARIENLCKDGFVMPSDYSYVNAIKASLLALQELKDKDKRPALEVCTPVSVSSALFEMAIKGLDVSKHTAYFIVRGDKLCLHESYFGKALQVKRIYPDFDPSPVVIHDGDTFVYEIDADTGYKRLVKHEQKLENLDNDFVGAYMYIPTADGKKNLYVMTKKQILAAWAKSSSTSQATHKAFTEKMCGKTIINSACNMIINSHVETSHLSSEYKDADDVEEESSITFEEAEVIEELPSKEPTPATTITSIHSQPQKPLAQQIEDF